MADETKEETPAEKTDKSEKEDENQEEKADKSEKDEEEKEKEPKEEVTENILIKNEPETLEIKTYPEADRNQLRCQFQLFSRFGDKEIQEKQYFKT